MSARRRRDVLLGGVAAAAALAPAAHAQTFPTRPVRIVHGYDAGSNPDVVSRLLASAIGDRLGQIVVEPRPGAGGRVSTGYVANQPPDGHTLGMITAGDGVLAALDPSLPYDLMRSFAFLSGVVEFPFLFLVRPESTLRTFDDLLAQSRDKPGSITFGTPGVRTTQHLTAELLMARAGIEMVHVPYRGNAVADVTAGRLGLIIAAPTIGMPLLEAGTLRALAVSGGGRMPRAPEVPTVAESVPDFTVVSWLGLVAPAQTPEAVRETLSRELKQALDRSEVRRRLAELGTDVSEPGEAAFRNRVAADIQKWTSLASRLNVGR